MSTNQPENTPQSKPLDDILLIMEHLKRMEVVEVVDQNIPIYGNWKG